jgi:hypothetical protein
MTVVLAISHATPTYSPFTNRATQICTTHGEILLCRTSQTALNYNKFVFVHQTITIIKLCEVKLQVESGPVGHECMAGRQVHTPSTVSTESATKLEALCTELYT